MLRSRMRRCSYARASNAIFYLDTPLGFVHVNSTSFTGMCTSLPNDLQKGRVEPGRRHGYAQYCAFTLAYSASRPITFSNQAAAGLTSYRLCHLHFTHCIVNVAITERVLPFLCLDRSDANTHLSQTTLH